MTPSIPAIPAAAAFILYPATAALEVVGLAESVAVVLEPASVDREAWEVMVEAAVVLSPLASVVVKEETKSEALLAASERHCDSWLTGRYGNGFPVASTQS